MARRAHRTARWMVGALTAAALAISGLSYVAFTGAAQAFAASSVGGQITSSEVIARAYDWLNRAPAYSPTTYIWDVGRPASTAPTAPDSSTWRCIWMWMTTRPR